MRIRLSLREKNAVPIEADSITPDNLDGKEKEEISKIKIWYGNREVELGSLFDIKVEESSEKEIILEGDLSRVKRIGEGMREGKITIKGDVDMHCGAMMSGGKIVVEGNADSWAGREMSGGELVIEGNAGEYLGSSYRGETIGMKGGRIVVKGNAGDFVGEHMGGGEIIVEGNVGIMAGMGMRGGKIVIKGDAILPGAEMLDGMVIVEGKVLEMLPGFRYEGEEEINGKKMKKYVGDLAVRGIGKGFLFVR
ncbi:MAG: formylmethanofuran dehydrogenase subunit C [Candidatus Syntropharchaeia archaeon]